jgi:glycosyltransferase involved in cell wall biosynthesis
MFFAKLLGKVIIKVPLGVAPRDRIYAPFVYKLFEKMSLCLSDYYIPEYETNTKQLKRYEQLKYPQKLLPAAHFFVLEDEFKIMKTINERENVVGYIGGFREIKGIVNFVKAIPLVLNKDNEIRFLIAGEGVLKNEIEKLIRKYPENKVTLIDWIPHEEVPKYLNELKLLVIPSYSEGVPNIAIEAMACGTPILSTKVGVIPMLIQNGKNGFILEDNSPECIASSIIEVLSRGNSYLKKIANNARYLIDEKYKFHSIVERWRRILNEIDKNLLAD